MASDIDIQPQRRLHPLSWLFALVAFVRQLVIPLAAVLFFGARDDGSLWGALFVVPLLAIALWRQFSYRYGFGPHSLVIREGWLFRNVRQIEYSRIENIDTERGLLHRLLGVAEVRLESSTGGKAEGLIRVLGDDAVQELRDRVFSENVHGSSEPAAEREPSQVLLHLTPGELLRYGLIDNRGMLIIAAFVGVLHQAGAFSFFRESVSRWLRVASGDWVATGLPVAALGAVSVLLLLMLTRLLSVVWALVTLHDFTLTRQHTDMRIRYGLLTSVALTLRLPRIQAVHQTQSLLHRLFDRVSLSVDLAGDGFDPNEQQGTNRTKRVHWLAPLCTRERAAEIISAALPMLDQSQELDWQPVSARARPRIFRKTLVISLLIGTAPAILIAQYWAPLLLLPLIPMAWWRAVVYARNTQWSLSRDLLQLRSGWLTLRLAIVPRNRVQVVQLSASPFDRRKNMATVIVDTAGSGVLGTVQIPYLDVETAARLAQTLYRLMSIPAAKSSTQGALHETWRACDSSRELSLLP